MENRTSQVHEASVKDISKCIKKLSAKKAMGEDGIAAIVIKKCSLVLSPCIAIIADGIMNRGDYPEIWKTAVVVPIPKIKGSSKPSDYRPISLLSIISKIVENHFAQILLWCITPDLSPNQFGFLRRRSTSDAILLLQHFILRGFEECEKRKTRAAVAVVYFDIAKAFDAVPHQLLVDNICAKYSLPQQLVKVIRSYLVNRKFKVKLGNVFSSESPVSSGVPQGSVLGPILFVAFINEITQVRLSEDSRLILYADDMALTHPIVDETAITNIQEDVMKINQGIQKLKLELNAKKCKYQIVGLRGVSTLPNLLITLNDTPLERVESYRYLGVDIDMNLSFESQARRVSINAKRAVGELSRNLRKWAPKHVFIEVCQKIAFPLFLYAIEVWFPAADKDRRRIERVLKFSARLATNDFRSETNYKDLLERLGWKSVERIVSERQLITIKKYMDGERHIPDYVFPLEVNQQRSSVRLVNKRNRETLLLKAFNEQRNKMENKLCGEKMRKLWNLLTEDEIRMNKAKFKEQIQYDEFYHRLCTNGVVKVTLE
jgi:hypothetical protein